ncbi:MAG: FliM/FliN family flagellar motor switch protein [Kofleriaceae bacterium]
MAVVPYPWAALPVADPAAARLAAWVSALDGMDLGLVGGLRWLGSASSVTVAEPVRIDLRHDRARAALVVPAALAIACADRLLDRPPGLAAPRAATDVEAALAAFAVAVALERAGVPATAAVGAGPVDGPVIELAVARPTPAVVALALDEDVAAPAPAPLATLVAGRGARLPPVRAAIVAAAGWIAGPRLAELAGGDVVVVGPPAAALGLARGCVAATLDRATGRLTVTGPYRRDAMPDPLDLLSQDLRVPLAVVVGEVEVSARQLLELGPGQVITLAGPVGGPVELRAGARLIGRGELVVVDGDLGVRVTEVLSPPSGAC